MRTVAHPLFSTYLASSCWFSVRVHSYSDGQHVPCLSVRLDLISLTMPSLFPLLIPQSIYGLTQSRLQSGLIVVLSATAFGFGVCTVILPWTFKDL